MKDRASEHQAVNGHVAPYYYGFLYGDGESATQTAEKILTDSSVHFCKVSLRNTPQPGMNFIPPTFITREGTFRGLSAIEAYLDWFVNDVDDNSSTTR